MNRLPRVKGKELIEALERDGFAIDRTQGPKSLRLKSHHNCKLLQKAV